MHPTSPSSTIPGRLSATLPAIFAACCVMSPASGSAAQPPALTENFPPFELGMVSALTASSATLFVFNDRLAAHMGDPWFGDPGPIDLAVTEALFRGEDTGSWLGGWPDAAGEAVAPAAAVVYYVSNGVTAAVRGAGWTRNPHALHEMVAFAEAFTATTTLTFTTKLIVGRERPLYALDRYPGTTMEPDAYQSFFSGHTSTSFCIAAFAARDVGDWLISGPLSGQGAPWVLFLGRLAPSLVFYGAAGVVGLSRIIDQKHYLSDVLAGAAVGTLMGNLSYSRHFDGSGRPKQRRSAGKVAVSVGFGPGRAWVAGRF